MFLQIILKIRLTKVKYLFFLLLSLITIDKDVGIIYYVPWEK